MCLDKAEAIALIHKAGGDSTVIHGLPSGLDAPLLDLAARESQQKSVTRWWTIVLLCWLATILVTYAIVVAFVLAQAYRWVGVLVVVDLAMLDYTVLWYYRASILKRPSSPVVVCFVSRAVLVACGLDLWLIGQAVLCGVHGTTLGFFVAQQWCKPTAKPMLRQFLKAALAQMEERLESLPALLQTRLKTLLVDTPFTAPTADKSSCGFSCTIKMLGSATGTLGLLLTHMTLLLSMHSHWDVVTATPWSLLENEHDQRVFGLGSVSLVVVATLCFATAYLEREPHRVTLSHITFCLACVTSGGSGVLLWVHTRSSIAVTVCALGPIAFCALVKMYSDWTAADMEFVPFKKKAAEGRLKDDVDAEASTGVCQSLRERNWRIAFALFIYVAAIVAAAVVLVTELGWPTLVIPAVLLITPLTVIGCQKYVATMEVDIFVACSLAAALVLHCLWTNMIWWLELGYSIHSAAALLLLALFVGGIALVILITALMRLRDQQWALFPSADSNWSGGPLALLACVCLLASGVAVGAYFMRGLSTCVTFIALEALAAYTVMMFVRHHQDPYLSVAWKVSVLCVGLLLVALGVYVGVVSSFFEGVSISWSCCMLLLLLWGWSCCSKSGIISTSTIFPIYEFNPHHVIDNTDALKNKSHAGVALVVALGALLLWSAFAQLFYTPLWVGQAALATFEVLSLLAFLSATHASSAMLGCALDQVLHQLL